MFTVIELQTNDGVTSALTYVYSEENQAYQKYHEILSYAAVSEIDIHASLIIDCHGYILKQEFFDRTQVNPTVEE